MGDTFLENKEGSHNPGGLAVNGTASIPAIQIPTATSIDYAQEKASAALILCSEILTFS